MKQTIRLIVVISMLAMIGLVIASIACVSILVLFETPAPAVLNRMEGEYIFHPDTILGDLAQGNTNVFYDMETPNAAVIRDPWAGSWEQTDYLKISGAFFHFHWNEPINSWKIRSIHFQVDCHEIALGPSSFMIQLFSINNAGELETRTNRIIIIDPIEAKITWSESEITPNVDGDFSLDLPNITMTVDEFLQMAEMEGGREARINNGNACSISLATVYFYEKYRWRATYTSDDLIEVLFGMTINLYEDE